MNEACIALPPKLLPVFSPARGEVRNRGAFGGRGSGKSFSFALMAAVFGYVEPLRILCTRELQVSIKESMHAELTAAIAEHAWLEAHYHVGESFIRGRNGTEFLFRGLRHNIGALKSTAQIDICIVEEAEDVPEASWLALEPTIRAPGSEIWPIWNPARSGSPGDLRFRRDFDPESMRIAELNADDNPWLPDVLKAQRKRDRRRMDPATFAHVWEGAYLEITDAQVLHGKVRVADLDDDMHDADGPYYGADWGFSTDPTALVRVQRRERDGFTTLYVSHEAVAVGCEITDTPALFDTVPGSKTHRVRADSARPETISHVRRAGFQIDAAPKWAGSVEDGIAWIRSHDEIVIHPRCKVTNREARLWSYKRDRLTGDVLPVLIDAENHTWDAVRYACAPMIKGAGKGPRVRSL